MYSIFQVTLRTSNMCLILRHTNLISEKVNVLDKDKKCICYSMDDW